MSDYPIGLYCVTLCYAPEPFYGICGLWFVNRKNNKGDHVVPFVVVRLLGYIIATYRYCLASASPYRAFRLPVRQLQTSHP